MTMSVLTPVATNLKRNWAFRSWVRLDSRLVLVTVIGAAGGSHWASTVTRVFGGHTDRSVHRR